MVGDGYDVFPSGALVDRANLARAAGVNYLTLAKVLLNGPEFE